METRFIIASFFLATARIIESGYVWDAKRERSGIRAAEAIIDGIAAHFLRSCPAGWRESTQVVIEKSVDEHEKVNMSLVVIRKKALESELFDGQVEQAVVEFSAAVVIALDRIEQIVEQGDGAPEKISIDDVCKQDIGTKGRLVKKLVSSLRGNITDCSKHGVDVVVQIGGEEKKVSYKENSLPLVEQKNLRKDRVRISSVCDKSRIAKIGMGKGELDMTFERNLRDKLLECQLKYGEIIIHWCAKIQFQNGKKRDVGGHIFEVFEAEKNQFDF